MTGEWRDCTIGELCDTGVVELQTGPFGTQLHAHDYVEDGVPVVPTEAIRNRQIDHSVLPKISPGKAEELARHRLELGDILFARRGVQATGHIGCVREAEDGFLCGTGAIRLRVRRGGGSINPDFLSHVLANPASVEWFKFHAIGATMPNLNEGIIRSFPLQIPPFPEQLAIAHILSTLDDKIELNRRMNETLEAIALALFKSWFVDFDPVRAKAEGRDPGLPKPLADLFPDSFEDAELEEIPKGWEVKSLGELVETVKGRSYKSEELVESDTALVTLKSFARGGGYRPDGLKSFAGTYKPNQVVKPGDLVIACTDVTQAAEVIGRPAIVRGSGGYRTLVASLDTLIVRPRNAGITRAFLYFLGGTEEFVAHTYAYTTGTTVLHLAKEAVPSFRVACPSPRLFEAFDSLASLALNRIQTVEEESATLGVLRDTLLPKLVAGEVKVRFHYDLDTEMPPRPRNRCLND
jgi:type I restriction enzyme S subunit